MGARSPSSALFAITQGTSKLKKFLDPFDNFSLFGLTAYFWSMLRTRAEQVTTAKAPLCIQHLKVEESSFLGASSSRETKLEHLESEKFLRKIRGDHLGILKRSAMT